MAKSSSTPVKTNATRSLVKKPVAAKAPAKAKPAAKVPAKSATKPAAKPAVVKLPAKSIVKATAKPAGKPVEKPAGKAAKKPISASIPVKKIVKPAPAPKPPATDKKKTQKGHSFSKTDLEKFRKDMLSMRAMLHAKASDMRTNALTRHDEINPEEDGTDIIERLKDLQLVNGTEQLIHQIDAALLSIAEGTYGVCEICHELIGKGRLQALPFAKTCIDCQSKLEQNRPMRSSAHWSDL